MGMDDGRSLRAALEKALEKDRQKEVVAALSGLERLEPQEPRWPQKLGDYLLRKGNKAEAEAAYLRALEVLAREGFLPRAVALAKLIVEINPARASILEKISQDAARALRSKPPLFPGLRPQEKVQQKPAPEARKPLLIEGVTPRASDSLCLAPGAPIPEAVASAPQLSRAADATVDEVRFDDLAQHDIVEVDASDMEVIELAPAKGAPPLPPPDPSAAMISKLSATALFAEASPRALAALVVVAQRMVFADDELVVKKGSPADAMFVIAEGMARVSLPALQSGGVNLSPGQIFGEACLVRRGKRQADVRAKGRLVLLRIGVKDLQKILADYPELNQILFGLLAGRLVANLLQTSSLFQPFDRNQRQEIARLFEVRYAPADTVLQEYGKRTDGLYVALMGEFDMEEGGLVATLAAGSIFGHASLLKRTPADRTIRASADSVVLRMPASRFASFASQYPAALEYLANLSLQSLSMWPSD